MAVKASDLVTLQVLPTPSVVRLYYVKQASNLAVPGVPSVNPPLAPWSATEPTYTEGSTDTVYTSLLTVWGDGFFQFGDVQKSAAFEAAKAAYNKGVAALAAANVAQAAAAGLVKAQVADPGHQSGRIWFQLNGSGNVVAMRISNGTVWAPYTLMAGQILVPGSLGTTSIADGAITTAKVNVTSDLWTSLLTVAGNATVGGNLLANGAVTARTMNVVSEAAGRFMSMKPDGIRIWDDSSYEDSPQVSLTSSSEQYISITDGQGHTLSSIDSAGGVTGSSVSAESSFSYRGTDMETLLKGPSRIYAYGEVNLGAKQLTAWEHFTICRITFNLPAGRVAEYTLNGFRVAYGNTANAEASQTWLSNYVASADTYAANGTKNPPPTTNLTTRDTISIGATPAVQWAGSTSTSRIFGPNAVDTTYVIVTTMQASGGGTVQCYGYAQAIVKDIGWKPAGSLGFEFINQLAASPTITGAPANPVQTDEKYYSSSSWGSFYGTGAAVAPSSMYYNVVAQGQYGTATQGAMRGLWTFPSMTSDLSGATIEAAQIYIKNEHSKINSGATAYLFSHGNASVPSTLAASTTNQITQAFAKGQGIWITIPSSHFAGLKSGAIRGYGLYVAGTENYGYWAKSAQIWLKYTK